jgi:hypothetical protein
VRRFLQQRGLVYIGKISYGVYLYHEAVRVAVWALMKPVMSSWQPSVGFVVRLADLRGGQLRAGRSQLRVLREEIPSAGRSLQARSRRCRRRGIALSVTPVGPQATARSRTDVSSFATK